MCRWTLTDSFRRAQVRSDAATQILEDQSGELNMVLCHQPPNYIYPCRQGHGEKAHRITYFRFVTRKDFQLKVIAL